MRRTPRAYILLEVAIGGALLAVLISTLLTTLATARTRNVKAGRDVIATQLVQEQLERERSVGYGNVPSATCPNSAVFSPVVGQTGVYDRSCEVAPTTRTVQGVVLNVKRVTVKVQYTPENGSPRTFTAVTEVYQ